MKMADVVELCVWQQIGGQAQSQNVGTDNVPWRCLWQGLGVPPVRILYRWSRRYALEGVLAGVRRAVVLEALARGGLAVVLAVL